MDQSLKEAVKVFLLFPFPFPYLYSCTVFSTHCPEKKCQKRSADQGSPSKCLGIQLYPLKTSATKKYPREKTYAWPKTTTSIRLRTSNGNHPWQAGRGIGTEHGNQFSSRRVRGDANGFYFGSTWCRVSPFPVCIPPFPTPVPLTPFIAWLRAYYF